MVEGRQKGEVGVNVAANLLLLVRYGKWAVSRKGGPWSCCMHVSDMAGVDRLQDLFDSLSFVDGLPIIYMKQNEYF
jgi:hypothetical protein